MVLKPIPDKHELYKNRFIEIWYIGIKIPIVFAFLEYAIILASTRKCGLESELKLGNQIVAVQEIISIVDQVLS